MKTNRSMKSGKLAAPITSGGKARVGKIVAGAGVLALAGWMTIGVGVSNAATMQTEGTYPTRSDCQAAGPSVEATTSGNWDNFWCVPDPNVANTWRLVLSSGN
jgi:hypothetical protein